MQLLRFRLQPPQQHAMAAVPTAPNTLTVRTLAGAVHTDSFLLIALASNWVAAQVQHLAECAAAAEPITNLLLVQLLLPVRIVNTSAADRPKIWLCQSRIALNSLQIKQPKSRTGDFLQVYRPTKKLFQMSWEVFSRVFQLGGVTE
jgi:hypothetical protein